MLGRLFVPQGIPVFMPQLASWIASNPCAGVLHVFDQILRQAHSMQGDIARALSRKSVQDNTEVANAYLPELSHMHVEYCQSVHMQLIQCQVSNIDIMTTSLQRLCKKPESGRLDSIWFRSSKLPSTSLLYWL